MIVADFPRIPRARSCLRVLRLTLWRSIRYCGKIIRLAASPAFLSPRHAVIKQIINVLSAGQRILYPPFPLSSPLVPFRRCSGRTLATTPTRATKTTMRVERGRRRVGEKEAKRRRRNRETEREIKYACMRARVCVKVEQNVDGKGRYWKRTN
ncbi:hypothetical protein PUN28_011641 [Cardiocondyla obscurior]|uniref:Uncharacterized protein n=1 Tax=Cardiocondyla obscurior TaxID=286306 RepID=A0AAW2FEW5_9HYME